MGKVVVSIRVTNWFDVEKVAAGETTQSPRSVLIDALVDTGAVFLYLKSSVVRHLGLRPIKEITSRTTSDRHERRTFYTPVDLEVAGRSAQFNVVEVPESLPNLVGQIPLEALDLAVNCKDQRLVPSHAEGELHDEFACDVVPV